jgi:ATP-dependent helicase/nuclease subunit B
MSLEYPALQRGELWDRLAAGHASGVTVITPNRRLGQELRKRYDAHQALTGQSAWETPDVLPFGAFLERLWDDAVYSHLAPALPLLITTEQEQAVWEEVIGGSRHAGLLLSASAAATQAREAWELAHSWQLLERLPRADRNEDVSAFLEWCERFRRVMQDRGLLERARLADALLAHLADGALKKPAVLVMQGFDLVTPRMRRVLEALAALGVELRSGVAVAHAARVSRFAAAVEKGEIAMAARWARARLEADPQARIGVVVPELARVRERVRRAFAQVMQPDFLLPGAESRPLPFDLSLGRPLADYPLVADALAIVRLGGRQVAYEEASRVLRSPFVAGGEREMAERARIDARLRERAGVHLGLDDLASAIAMSGTKAPLLADRLEKLAAFRRSDLFAARDASSWARAVSQSLDIVGFPGERMLDSGEHQVLKKWHGLLASFATLERVTGKLRHGEMAARLARMAAETIFQPETPDAPIAVLGVLESAGIEFDHLWVMGLTSDAWPIAPRPNPFIPLRVQREAGVPEADATASLELDRRITAGWMRAAGEVVFSHARMRDDAELMPSPLVAAVPAVEEAALRVPAFETLAAVLHRRRAVERIPDGRAPPVSVTTRSGGTALFQDQAACPFRAFARHRLASRPVQTPQPGLDAMERGTLLHAVLAYVWEALGDKARLDAMALADLERLVGDAADRAIAKLQHERPRVLEGSFARIERERLAGLARQWLDFERGREDFTVVATERKKPATFGGITVNVKLDRLDRLADNSHAVLDYKSGKVVVASWLPPRTDEPQLPMYAVSADEPVSAVAFARVRPGEAGFCGIARTDGLLRDVKSVGKSPTKGMSKLGGWDDLVDVWRRDLDALGEAFSSGDALVDPKDESKSCRRCDQQVFCRIAEKRPWVNADPDEDADED